MGLLLFSRSKIKHVLIFYPNDISTDGEKNGDTVDPYATAAEAGI